MSEREPTAPRTSGATRILEALPEAKRNDLLRRSDWRYLLPDAAPALALCLAGTELWACCEVIAREVHDAPRKGVRYDLVVAENPSGRELRRMAAAMSPSGACYTEWTRVAPLGPARLHRRLTAAGFHDPAMYRPWPSLSPCRAWVPTHGSAAQHHWRGVHALDPRAPRESPRIGWGAPRSARSASPALRRRARRRSEAAPPARGRGPRARRMARRVDRSGRSAPPHPGRTRRRQGGGAHLPPRRRAGAGDQDGAHTRQRARAAPRGGAPGSGRSAASARHARRAAASIPRCAPRPARPRRDGARRRATRRDADEQQLSPRRRARHRLAHRARRARELAAAEATWNASSHPPSSASRPSSRPSSTNHSSRARARSSAGSARSPSSASSATARPGTSSRAREGSSSWTGSRGSRADCRRWISSTSRRTRRTT